jgi:1,4-alpha-glucan branching enzyme
MAEMKAEKSIASERATIRQRPLASETATPQLRTAQRASAQGNKSRVTFRLPAAAVANARKVTLVGEFNNWDPEATPLSRLETGDFAVTIQLDRGKEYRFRYLIDGERWENDWSADKYVKGPFGSDDSVVAVRD